MTKRNKNKPHRIFERILNLITLIFLLVVYVEIPSEINYQPNSPDTINIKHPLDYLKEGNGASDYANFYFIKK